jgi:hypothetical protein
MGTTFHPDVANFKYSLELDVSVFNRIVVLELLGIKEDTPVGDIEADKIDKLLDKVDDTYVGEDKWPLSSKIEENRAVYYKSKITTILAYCLGKGCSLTWA